VAKDVAYGKFLELFENVWFLCVVIGWWVHVLSTLLQFYHHPSVPIWISCSIKKLYIYTWSNILFLALSFSFFIYFLYFFKVWFFILRNIPYFIFNHYYFVLILSFHIKVGVCSISLIMYSPSQIRIKEERIVLDNQIFMIWWLSSVNVFVESLWYKLIM